MTRRRIIYVLEPYPFPAGGVATIYRHVEILAAHGVPAFVALSRKPEVDYYDTRAPLIVHGGNMPVMPGDVFVIPEGLRDHARALRATPAKRFMFCQNQYYLPFGTEPQAGIAEFGVHGIIASSEAVRAFFRDVYGLEDLPLLPYAIDATRFAPSSAPERRIAYMPRKLREEAAFIEATFRRRHRRHRDVPWLAIHRVPQREAARLMAQSAVFLSLSHQESFGLPPLEAMASGCLVAGFHGDGGREYMNPENGWWAKTGDWKACVDGLAAALDLLDGAGGGGELAGRRAAMAATVASYSPERLEKALLEFWRAELAKPFANGG